MMQDISADQMSGHNDAFYASLTKVHEGLSFEDSAALNARLVLILANLVGDMPKLKAAIDLAKG